MSQEHPFESFTTYGVDETCLEAARHIIDIDLALAGMQVAVAAVEPDKAAYYMVFGHPKELHDMEVVVKQYVATHDVPEGVRIDFPSNDVMQATRAALLGVMDIYL